jgi:peptidyl-prolyl cis-trans isomerase D
MLRFMRERMGKTFLVLIVAGISLVFVFFGVFPETPMGGGGASGNAVAAVGKEKITARQLMNAVNREMENYRQLGVDLPPELVQNIKQGTLNSLVQGKLMLAEARRLGVQASDKEVGEAIRELPYFQDPEKKVFSVERYRQVLADNNLSPAQFEDDLRESLTLQRLQNFLMDRIRVTPTEVEREFKVSNETRNLSFVRFTREDAMKKMKVTSQDVDEFLADQAREAQINGFYAQNNMRYNQPEKVCARHILKREARPEADAKAPKAFLDLRPTAANFASLARRHSEDPGSKDSGGDLDCFERGVMDQAFEQAAFSLPVGRVSEPVKSQFGWHYILVTKKVPAVSRPLEQVRREIAEELIKRDRVDEIRKINVAAAEAAMRSWPAGGKVETTGEFNGLEGMIPKIGRADEILKAAFDPKAKIQSSPQLFEAQGGVIVAVVSGRRSANMSQFKKDEEMHARTLKERKLQAFLPAWLEDVKGRTKVSYNASLLNQL